ncbi:MAG: hypothetical protein NTZ78_09040 [Candidatus Aureabacteria bacterium]|nr:hypothetical protein [Candidatus Auribacterota bacterium]
MKRERVRGIAVAGAVIIALFLIRACVERRRGATGSGGESGEGAATAPRVSEKNGARVITLDETARRENDIVASPLAAGAYRKQRSVYGSVCDIEPLLALRNDYLSAQATAEETRRKRDASRTEYARSKEAGAGRLSAGGNDVAAARQRVLADEVRARGVDRRLGEMERAARARWGNGLVHALLEQPALLDRLAGRKDLLIQVALAAGNPAPASRVSARVTAPDGTFLTAALVSPLPLPVAAASRGSAAYFYLAPADAAALAPGTMLTVDVPEGPETAGVIIPETAIVYYEGAAWVYIQTEPDRFSRRTVSPETPVPGGWFAPGGFTPGEIVITDGAQLLLSAEFLSQYEIIEIAE